MINRALRTMDGALIINMGFYISDLYRHIKQLHSQQFATQHSDNTFIVYRGQGLLKADFDQLKNTKGGLIAFNNFLSTSKDREVSLCFAESNACNPDLVGVLFVMTIDPSQSPTPFASITGSSYFADDADEILFAMHSVFRIQDIKSMNENTQLFQVDLMLTTDNDKDLYALTEHIRTEISGSTGWYQLGVLLRRIGQLDKAEEIYKVLLDRTADESEKANIYYQLGWIKDHQGQYPEAIAFCEKSIEISRKTLPSNHCSLATLYNNTSMVYRNMGEYSKALPYHERALEIQQKSLPPNHPDLATSYNNIGSVYNNMGNYSKALSYYEKALAIQQQSLSPNHPDLGNSYNNIGLVYNSMGDYSKALSNYEKALVIQQQSLPPNHPDLATSYNNIGSVYNNMGNYSKALSYYEKALAIQQQSLPPNHPDLGNSYNNIGLVYNSMGDSSKALSHYEKALEIQQQSLPSNHPYLSSSYNNVGETYKKMSNYAKAYSFYERAVNIAKHSLPSNHPHLQAYRKDLELMKSKL